MSARENRAGKPETYHQGSDLQTYAAERAARQLASNQRRTLRAALGHLARHLDRPPLVCDLDAAVIGGQLAAMSECGCPAATLARVRSDLVALAACAVAEGLIPPLGPLPAVRVDRQPPAPAWPAEDLSHLLLSARSMPGTVGLLPARLFWPAFLLASVDCELSSRDLFALPRTAFDHRRGTLRVGLLVHDLHPLTIDALNALRPFEREELLPWRAGDGRRLTLDMLYYHFRKVLFRAGLPHVQANLPQRLVRTARDRSALDGVDLSLPFTPRPEPPRHPRRRDAQPRRPRVGRQRRVFPAAPAGESIREFLEAGYIPQRLVNPDSIRVMRDTVNVWAESLEREPRFSDLSDDGAEAFTGWMLSQGRAIATANKHLRNLLSLWRYAWRKRRVAELPRDVEYLREPKRVPEAYTPEEVGRIVATAERMPGRAGMIPNCLWLPALVLTAYYTGLRIGALLKLKRSALDLNSGWLTVPADIQKQQAEQVFQLPADALAAIAATDPASRPLLFGMGWKNETPALVRLRAALKLAGLPRGRRDLFHKLRRTAATLICDAAGEAAAQRHLGHSSVATTRRYIDPRKLTRRTAAELMPQPTAADCRSDAGPGPRIYREEQG